MNTLRYLFKFTIKIIKTDYVLILYLQNNYKKKKTKQAEGFERINKQSIHIIQRIVDRRGLGRTWGDSIGSKL